MSDIKEKKPAELIVNGQHVQSQVVYGDLVEAVEVAEVPIESPVQIRRALSAAEMDELSDALSLGNIQHKSLPLGIDGMGGKANDTP